MRHRKYYTGEELLASTTVFDLDEQRTKSLKRLLTDCVKFLNSYIGYDELSAADFIIKIDNYTSQYLIETDSVIYEFNFKFNYGFLPSLEPAPIVTEKGDHLDQLETE